MHHYIPLFEEASNKSKCEHCGSDRLKTPFMHQFRREMVSKCMDCGKVNPVKDEVKEDPYYAGLTDEEVIAKGNPPGLFHARYLRALGNKKND